MAQPMNPQTAYNVCLQRVQAACKNDAGCSKLYNAACYASTVYYQKTGHWPKVKTQKSTVASQSGLGAFDLPTVQPYAIGAIGGLLLGWMVFSK